MKRLSQFLYKLLLTALVGIFISIGTFPGEVIALNLVKIPPQFRNQARQQEAQEAQLRKPRLGGATPGAPEQGDTTQNARDVNGCPQFDNQQPDFPNTLFLPSENGVLETTLTADDSRSDFSIGKATFQTVGANQTVALYKANNEGPDKYMYMPPILRVSPGDTIKLKLDNDLTNKAINTVTNLHYHGFNVSPNPGADDVLVEVPAGDVSQENTYQMNFKIPDNHQPGLFWYHPHIHTDSDPQVFGGMSGGIIVEGFEKYYPIVNGIPSQTGLSPLSEKVILFKDLGLKDTSGTRYACYTLNGLVNPKITIQPGEVQFWRIGNIGADTYMNLSLEDANQKPQPFYILARDGNAVSQPIEQDQILLPPAKRVEVLVIGSPSGQYNLVSKPVPNTDPGNSWSSFDQNQRIVATVSVEGDPVNYDTEGKTLLEYIKNQKPTTLGSDLPSLDDVAKLVIPKEHQRQFTFSQNTGNKDENNNPIFVYQINNLQYDPTRTDTKVNVGDIEEWTLVNATPVRHVFHIHQLDFLVTKVNGVDQPLQGYEDSIDLPPCSVGISNDTCQPGTESKTVVRIPFTNEVIAATKQGGVYIDGEFVYHCHLLFHEDNGMMQNIQVLPASAQVLYPAE